MDQKNWNRGFLATAVLYSVVIIIALCFFIILKNLQTTRNFQNYASMEVKDSFLYYDVFYDGNGQTAGEMDKQRIAVGREASLSKCQYFKFGYRFVGWTMDSSYSCSTFFDEKKCYLDEEIVKNLGNVGDEITLYAQWTERDFVITFDPNGGEFSLDSESTKLLLFDSVYGQLPVPIREGYTFQGWYTGKDDGERIYENTKFRVGANQTLYAHWEQKRVLLSTKKQGDYVAYVGNNGCLNNGKDIRGDRDAESGNSCLGWNANQSGSWYLGYCYTSREKFQTMGWRIAYIENNRAYLISAGSPECNTRPESTKNAEYIKLANQKAKKYCNPLFVDGDCSNNQDSWAIGDTDFYKMTKVMYKTGWHLTSYYGNPYCKNDGTTVCGKGNDLIDIGGYYWFAAAHDDTGNSFWSTVPRGVYWDPYWKSVIPINGTSPYGLRPVIRLSSSVYVTGGSGTMTDPYTISN